MVCFFLEGGVPKIHIYILTAVRMTMAVRVKMRVMARMAMRGSKISLNVPFFSQECNLTEDEQAYLTENLPSTNAIIGVLTRTNIDNRKMVNFLSM
jgi:hypothetical protein